VKNLADAAIDTADSRAGICFKDDFVTRAGLGFVSNPGGDAACPIP